MNTKMSRTGEASSAKIKSLGNQQKTLKTNDVEHKIASSKEVLLFSQNHVVEITVKREKMGQKRTSPVASCSPGQKGEKKRPTNSDNKTSENWGDRFRQQNMLHIKGQLPKHSEDKEAKNTHAKKQQKSAIKHSITSKEKHSKTPCCSSILVRDCAVQCSEIYNNSNKLAEFSPVHVLNLIRQLKDLVNKDKKTCEIFTEMEQILQKITDPETKPESSAVPLKDSSKKMKTTSCELCTLEKEKFSREILKRDEQLKELDQKNTELEFHAKLLAEQLDETTRKKDETTRKKNDTILELRQQVEDLKRDLNKQIQVANKNYIDNKWLTMEIDRLSKLSDYKDTHIIDYQNSIKELQSQITKQLKTVSKLCMKEGSPHISLVHTGHACSSPTSSLSNCSDKSWHDLTDISSVDSVSQEHGLKQDAPVTDTELVSLLDGESSHTIILDENQGTNGIVTQNNDENYTDPYQSVNANDVIAKKSLHHFSKKNHNKDDIYKTKKFTTRFKKKQNDNTKNSFHLNASNVLENVKSTKSTIPDVRKQDDMQNRRSINVPSPLRDCPHPDWSDSSLSSISTASNLDMIPSNDV